MRTPVNARTQASDLTHTHERVLTLLAHQARPLSTGAIARKLRLSPTTITRAGRILRDRGLVDVHGRLGNELVFVTTEDGWALVALLDEAEGEVSINGIGPASHDSPVVVPDSEPEQPATDRAAMEAAVWAWANEVMPRDLAIMPRGQLTRLWEATR